MYMRYWIFYSVSAILLLLGITVAVAAPAETPVGKRILIINSYGEHIKWSKDIADSLERKILKIHPDWMVYSGDLRTESAVYTAASALTLRSIIWGYAERTQTSVKATDLKTVSLFVQDDIPDALVWIGEEGFMNYISYIVQLGKWRRIPMVLCAVKDSISANGWYPERPFRFDSKLGIRDYFIVGKSLPLKDPFIEMAKKDSMIAVSRITQEGQDLYQLDFKMNYSGNIVKLPIRQNLELIHRMLPDLKELIWVDRNSYRSMETQLEVENTVKKVMPGVKYIKMISNFLNTDSIYDVMLEPAEHRAFLTYSWNISGVHSKRCDKEIDSLFTNVLTTPLFTLTKRDFDQDNYWVGGCYLNLMKSADFAMGLLERAVQGDCIMTLPFDTLSETGIVLNRTAVERFKLAKVADEIEGVTYVHIPPDFVHKYEKQLLVSILVLVLVCCYAFISWRHNRYNKRIKADYARYKRLYDKLQVIYKNSSIDFALYDENGKRVLRIINGTVETSDGNSDLFLENIFESPYLSDDLKEQIRSQKTVNCEVSLDYAGRLSRTNFAESEVYQLIVKPLHEIDNDNSYFMAIAVNLTPTIRERQEKERFEDLFRFASDSSQVGVVFYDAQSAVGMATDSWCKNMNETYVSGTFPTYERVVAGDREALLKFQETVRAGGVNEPFCRDIQVLNADGKEHWIRQHMYFIQPSNRLVELSLCIDEQKQSEKKLEEAKLKAEEANEETRGFLNSISHEVRTPLNSIVGFSMILSMLNDEEGRNEYTPIILHNIRLLDALITNILDLSALDGGEVSFCYIQSNVADIFLDMEKYVRNSNLHNCSLQFIRELPEVEAERFITTDREYLQVILWNLLSNAVKFTEEGSITLGYKKEENGSYYFYVTDTGCGIAPEDQKIIFNRFVKLDEYVQGTGLGLALCKSIVKHLNGEIGVISEKGKGSTFWFVLPSHPVI